MAAVYLKIQNGIQNVTFFWPSDDYTTYASNYFYV